MEQIFVKEADRDKTNENTYWCVDEADTVAT